MLLVLIIIYLQSQNNTVYAGLTADGDDSILFPLSSYLLLTGDRRYPEGFALSLSLSLSLCIHLAIFFFDSIQYFLISFYFLHAHLIYHYFVLHRIN